MPFGRNNYVFRGESEQALKEILSKNGGLNATSYYEPTKPPIGNIHVGCDYKKSWIWNHNAFYGWNINKYESAKSKKIVII